MKRWICDDGIETKPYGYNPLEDEGEGVEEVEEEEGDDEERNNSNDSDEDSGDLELM